MSSASSSSESASSASSSASSGGSGGSGGGIDYCSECGKPFQSGTIAAKALVEASGLVASAVNPGAYFVENDSGNPPSVFALDATGKDLGEYQLMNATNVDWEDVARGPCAQGSCIYAGDIGDNAMSRASYVLYRFVEPKTLSAGQHAVASEAFPFKYPDGSHNAETLLVDPTTGEIAIVTKVGSGPSGVYVFPQPLTPGVEVMLTKAGMVTPPQGVNLFTSGDVHPMGTGVLLRTYSHVFYYPKAKGQSIADALSGAGCALQAPNEVQGEAIAWTLAGDGFLTTSEGAAAPISAVSCVTAP